MGNTSICKGDIVKFIVFIVSLLWQFMRLLRNRLDDALHLSHIKLHIKNSDQEIY